MGGEELIVKEEPAVHPNPTTRQAPTVLTVTEVMDLLRIGRTKAYEQARLFLDTDGVDGLPCVRVGDSIRFPRHAIEALLGQPIPWPITDTTDTDPPSHVTPLRTSTRTPHASTTPNSPQLFSA